MKLEVNYAKSTQTSIPELNKEEKNLYYLIIGEGDDKVIINIGKATLEKIQNLHAKTVSKNLVGNVPGKKDK